MVIVDLYPFSETVKNESSTHQDIIEKIDIGGVSLIRAAGKNYKDVLIVSNKDQYSDVCEILSTQEVSTSLEQRMKFAGKSFELTTKYDSEIAE
jgi:phosphoribosylaminoimidazolecarboxamide formyltransferase / IMP cyclohydrolase